MTAPGEVGNEIAGSLGRVSKALTAGIRTALREVATDARTVHQGAATIGAGGDRRFSRWPAAPLSIGTKILDGTELRVSPRGAWGLAESGRSAGPMKAWGHPAHHPGTRGWGSWSKAAERVLSGAEKIIPDTLDDAVEGAV